ncbi:Uncharacterised protein [Burkholderia pseudomallei]|uniref:hypothetical protein n=1 Tax=Burkholderia pseudomallei TaxID=28450 RepID=UPI000717F293|nr:hypothetical protein [Burkholderia pseudomallei]NAX10193.1 hypothetical protein [Burkholderia pseudomallei]NAX98994.1 hypothetical protein [Burkholderia pseudomallei]NAY17627.1 hypothetical protein [Burkholderia pseudomallei]NAY24470.1 hypothetical protein [Burkholderia pseudomallei]NAY31401.1 hypothetical protein [Burkholderia pseudomallei]
MTEAKKEKDDAGSIKSAFGAENRARLINAYFAAQPEKCITSHQAWVHVYRLLLWTDQTTGLGHCYESDKSQPGKRWYARSLAFHDWVSTALGTKPSDLAQHIDWLFLRAAEDLAADVLKKATKVAARAKKQREPYDGRGFPRPGEDPELVNIVKNALGLHLGSEPPPEVWDALVQKVRQYLALDNKRKNLVGEGFEDVIAQVVRRTCPHEDTHVFTRRALHELPGFNRVRAGDKPNKVDVAVTRPSKRILVTAKWSVRADREKQFITDFTDYVNAESDRKPFEYVFVTNEFDPARLMRACEQLIGNALMFTHVVHISTDAIRATYKSTGDGESEAASMQKVLKHIEDGRLISLGQWLSKLAAD